ncbi:CLUMA_CG011616, isoform A [Clunio marinus]|uniref:CLUMA_CG011616, isoform A n=1 Tax=Clunio marinus TaxID=568069 RepID=A0A1J1IGT7_9DIPT|nr:CLUMA_CG011616, isoform A [Clunio marinus]
MSSKRRRSRSPHYESERVRSNMRMDRKPNATRISDPSHPAGKRKELDNVMKKARQQPTNEYWDKKLLEVEEKDPNRWKHTGYKKMYVHGSRRSRSRSPIRKTPESPRGRHNTHSPPRRRVSRTPERYKQRSPVRHARDMPKRDEKYRNDDKYRAGVCRPTPPPQKAARTPSVSSCSEDSCSVCSSDDNRRGGDEAKKAERYHGPMNRMRPKSPALGASKQKTPKKVATPKQHSSRRRRSASGMANHVLGAQVSRGLKKVRKNHPWRKLKVEGQRSKRQASSESSSSSDLQIPSLTATTCMTLSDRFGKMAEWNNDRTNNDRIVLKITKETSGDRSAFIYQDPQHSASPPPSRYEHELEGRYPESESVLNYISAKALGLNWYNVRVRYEYYKSKGYLRDLTLDDYKKWEDWWYRYQKWLDRYKS